MQRLTSLLADAAACPSRSAIRGQVIDVLVSIRRDAAAVYPAVLDVLVLPAWHDVEQHANSPIDADRRYGIGLGVPAGLPGRRGVRPTRSSDLTARPQPG